MPNFNDFKLRIVRELGADVNNDLSMEVDQAVKDAIEFYSGERFYFLETTANFPTIPNTPEYGVSLGMPDDIQEIDDIQVNVHNNTYLLTRRSHAWWIDIQSNPIEIVGAPTDWSWYEQAIFLYPSPSEIFTLTLYYLRRRESLDDPNDHSPWLDGLPGELIRSRAKWQIFDNVIQSSDEADRMERQTTIALEELRMRSVQLISAGIVKSESW